ncbi:hypothetical protein [Sulfitobacter sp. SH24]|uniref:hypothetical protein n=1 Tax=Sulfitobacter sp. SH24 TaxID=3421173 RepID=UPI003F4FCB62
MLDQYVHQEALSRAIFEAVETAREVAEAWSQFEAMGELVKGNLDPIASVLRGDLVADSFTEKVVHNLQELAESIEPAISSETRTSLHFDECCTSGSWEEIHMTERGYALLRMQKAVARLADRISTVLNVKNAEKLSSLLSV